MRGGEVLILIDSHAQKIFNIGVYDEGGGEVLILIDSHAKKIFYIGVYDEGGRSSSSLTLMLKKFLTLESMMRGGEVLILIDSHAKKIFNIGVYDEGGGRSSIEDHMCPPLRLTTKVAHTTQVGVRD